MATAPIMPPARLAKKPARTATVSHRRKGPAERSAQLKLPGPPRTCNSPARSASTPTIAPPHPSTKYAMTQNRYGIRLNNAPKPLWVDALPRAEGRHPDDMEAGNGDGFAWTASRK